jgi:acetylornithine deacetylase/succinyl-diaminopimelate desuccinylase-like protein
MNKQSLESAFNENETRFIEEWKTLVSFPSISAQPQHEADCRQCAEWLVAHLASMGLASRLVETPTKPLVFAERKAAPGHPTVLFYGHYDVQPVDPLNEWSSPPFSPEIRDGRLYGRGAEDNKGQLFYVLKALEVLLKNNSLHCGLKILIEGEEEANSSAGLKHAIRTGNPDLKADLLLVTDCGMAPSGNPCIIMGLRGIVSLTVSLSGPSFDLHSGNHGGLAPNPAEELIRLVANLHNADGGIALKEFMAGIRPLTPEERTLAATEPFDPVLYESQSGVPPTGGDRNFPPVERAGFQPTITVNGFASGYSGPGGKTIIPARAMVKLSARLVSDQDPSACLKILEDYFRKNSPPGLRIEISESSVGGPPLRVHPNCPHITRAAAVLKELYEKDPSYMYEGASIPIIPELARAARCEPLLVGFSLPEDRIHAPNESFQITRFRKGFLFSGLLLSSL